MQEHTDREKSENFLTSIGPKKTRQTVFSQILIYRLCTDINQFYYIERRDSSLCSTLAYTNTISNNSLLYEKR